MVVCRIRVAQDRADRLIARAAAQPGTLFGLVNNAGTGKLRPLLEESVADWRDTFETNLEAAFFLAQRAIESMRPQREGRIVNIASMHGIVGMSNLGTGREHRRLRRGIRPVRCSAYTTSKGGVIQLTRDLAAAVGRWGINNQRNKPGTDDHTPKIQREMGSTPGKKVVPTGGLPGRRRGSAIRSMRRSSRPWGCRRRFSGSEQ